MQFGHFSESGRVLYQEKFVCGEFCPWGGFARESYVPGEFLDWRELYLESFEFSDFGRVKFQVNFLLECFFLGMNMSGKVLLWDNFLLESNVRREMSGREKFGRVL